MAKQTVIVSVLADTKKFSKAFGGLSRDSGMKKFTSGLAGLARTTAKTVGGIAAGIAGLAIGGGIARALKLDEARTQLSALGYSGKQVTGIMDSALKSVKGTSFGLDTAATVAANALASGIKPGKDLTRSLTTVANTAALAKVDMSEMGSIFQKVWANGKVTTQEMNQLADRGVPIWQYLSEAFGVSNAELRKMISSGEVTADMFMNALGPAVDGMAVKMGSSFKGMAKNAMAALGRLGALFAAPAIEAIKPWLASATDLVDDLAAAATPLAERFGTWLSTIKPGVLGDLLAKARPLVETLVSMWAELSPVAVAFRALQPLIDPLSAAFGGLVRVLAGALITILPELVTLLAKLLPLLVPLIGGVLQLATGALTAAAGIVEWVVANREWLAGLAAVAAAIGAAIGAIHLYRAAKLGLAAATYGAAGAQAVAGASATAYNIALKAQAVATNIAAGATRLFNAALKANPIGIIITALTALVGALVWFFTQTETGRQIWDTVWAGIQTVVAGFVDWFSTSVAPTLQAIWEGITEAASAAAAWYQEHVAPIFAAFGELIGAIFEKIGEFATWLWEERIAPFLDGLATGWNAAWALISQAWEKTGKPVFEKIAPVIKAVQIIWNAAWAAIGAVFSGIWNGIRIVVETVLGVIRGVIQTVTALIRGDWEGVWNGIKGIGETIWNGILAYIGNIVDTLRNVVTGTIRALADGVGVSFERMRDWIVGVVVGLFERVTGFFSGLRTQVVQAVVGLVNGAVNGFGQLMAWVRSIPSNIMSFFSGAGSWLRNAGWNMIVGLINGIADAGQWLYDRISSLIGGAIDFAKRLLGINSPSRVFRDIGKWTVRGMEDGLSGPNRLKRIMGGLTRDVENGFDPTLTLDGTARGRLGGGARIEITITAGVGDPVEIGRQVVNAIRSYERAGGIA